MAAVRLDFVVIGAQKAGTTTLWHHLASHPGLALPASKEAPFLVDAEAWERGLEAFVAERFGAAPAGARLGTVTPHYATGAEGLGVPVLAERLARVAADARLVMLLREPRSRALAAWRMQSRRGVERRSPDEALGALLEPAALETSRARPDETNTYVVAGEYARVLETYLRYFPREHLLVRTLDELATDPATVLADVFAFLGVVERHQPPDVGARLLEGGSGFRVPPETLHEIRALARARLLPHLEAEEHWRGFEFLLEAWNVVPDAAPPRLAPSLEAALDRHYADDAQGLARLGVPVPWAPAWAGPALEEAVRQTRGALREVAEQWREQARLRDALEERLRRRGSPVG